MRKPIPHFVSFETLEVLKSVVRKTGFNEVAARKVDLIPLVESEVWDWLEEEKLAETDYTPFIHAVVLTKEGYRFICHLLS
jgi:cobalamin biosynthesis Co2+ chelatase CbiK